MQSSRRQMWKGRPLAVALGIFLVAVLTPIGVAWAQVCPAGSTFVTAAGGVAALCAVPGNMCAGGVATLNGNACIEDGAVFDFNAAGLSTVNVGGTIALEDKRVNQGGISCPAKPSPELTILAGDLTVKSGGNINGDTELIPGGITNGGALFIQLTAGGINNGDLIVEPNARITSDRLTPAGNGRGGNLTFLVDGQILVQALPGSSINDPTTRGIISANTQAASRMAFFRNCGLTEIVMVATGDGAPASEAIRIDGTLEIVFPPPSVEGVVGGRIFMVGGGTSANLALPPFPTALPVTAPNPPDTSTRVVVGPTGLINTDAKDSGGGEIRIWTCFLVVEGFTAGVGPGGLVQAGGNAHTGIILGRESLLPVIIAVTANETITVNSGGRILGTLREGFKLHDGQGPLCEFMLQFPPKSNGPIVALGQAGSDICLIARTDITLNGTIPALTGRFAATANVTNGSSVGGTVVALSTQEGLIALISNAIDATAVANGGKGGLIMIQAADDVAVTSLVRANGTGPTGSGGVIQFEAINGEITTPAGLLQATDSGAGIIQLRECLVNAANNPVTNPAATLLAADCGNPNLITPVPALAACAGCFCLDGFRIRAGTLTITGHNLDDVGQVEVNAPGCDPGTGVAQAFTVNAAGDRIMITPAPALISGSRIILSNPGIGPSSSCSLPVP